MKWSGCSLSSLSFSGKLDIYDYSFFERVYISFSGLEKQDRGIEGYSITRETGYIVALYNFNVFVIRESIKTP